MSVPVILVDTNVLVYAHDTSETEKRDIARRLLISLKDTAHLHVSAQVLGEYYVALTRKLDPPLDPASAMSAASAVAAAMPVVESSRVTVRDAMWAADRYKMHYYDAHVWATAVAAGAIAVLTEDTPSAEVIEGVRYIDPFASGQTTNDILQTLI